MSTVPLSDSPVAPALLQYEPACTEPPAGCVVVAVGRGVGFAAGVLTNGRGACVVRTVGSAVERGEAMTCRDVVGEATREVLGARVVEVGDVVEVDAAADVLEGAALEVVDDVELDDVELDDVVEVEELDGALVLDDTDFTTVEDPGDESPPPHALTPPATRAAARATCADRTDMLAVR